MRKLYISSWNEQIVAAAAENGKVMALYVCHDEEDAIGSIYKGVVKSEKTNIHAYFINIGKEKELFLHKSDCIEPNNLHVGDEVIVQITKASSRHKSRQATMNVSLVGDYLIYSPFANFIAVSKKMSASERETWHRFANEQKREQEGMIIRTAVLSASKDAVEKELRQLRKQMKQIIEKSKQIQAPALLYKGNDCIKQIASRYVSHGFSIIVTDCKKVYELFKGKLQQDIMYETSLPIHLQREIQLAMKKVIWMQDGSYLLIEENESLTLIDVNSGHSSLDPFSINQQAAFEAMRQLRLRNIGGMIVIDFLRTREDERIRIQKTIEEAAENDVHTVSIFGFTRMGLFELTRKKIGRSLKEVIEMSEREDTQRN